MKNALKCYVVEMAPTTMPKHYYIGTSTDVDNRVRDHVNGKGSAWVAHVMQKYALKRAHVVEEYDNVDPLTEDTVTKKYMIRYGIQYVRGGSYCAVELPPATIQFLLREFHTASNACFKCGQCGHFASACRNPVVAVAHPKDEQPSVEQPWFNLSALSSIANNVVAVTNAVAGLVHGHPRADDASHGHVSHGNVPHEPPAAVVQPTVVKPTQRVHNACYRCGRYGHFASKCYAATHIDGRKL